MATTSEALSERLVVAYGAAPESVVDLRASRQPAHINYFGLTDAPGAGADVVVEHQGQALLYVIDGVRLAGDDRVVEKARRLLALRADASFLAVALPGTLRVFDLRLAKGSRAPLFELGDHDLTFIPRLAAGELSVPAQGKTAHDYLFGLLDETIGRLRGDLKVSPSEVMALVGRALFLRFLQDRRLLTPNVLDSIAGGKSVCDLMADPATAAASSQWLDVTFNGDLLTLPDGGSKSYFEALHARTQGQALLVLSAILGLDEPVGGAYQRRFDWGEIDFAYVPVGLLSEVYEEHLHRFEPTKAKSTSVYYTPRRLAEFMTHQLFEGLVVPKQQARLLDPACGAGVFLVSGFRRLVQESWRALGRPPKTAEIRNILNTQLSGFDTNTSALQLSALALYLTALELDPDPTPLDKRLKFLPLLGRVLHDVSTWQNETSNEKLGSLCSPVPESYRAAYDGVWGNPPWTSWEKSRGPALTEIVRSCAIERGIPVPTDFKNPDQVPDLAFVWQATRWAKPGAPIAFALAARLLFKISEAGIASRRLLLQGIRVTGVLNGTELRQTRVWPKVSIPFCLLFAANERPSDGATFTYLSPRLEDGLNRQGRLRLDPSAAQPVRIADAIDRPFAFKTLYKGDGLDLDLFARLEARSDLQTLGQLIAVHELEAGEGYQRASGEPPPRWLKSLPDLIVDHEPPASAWIEANDLPRFSHRHVLFPRRQAIYRAPLVLVRQAPTRDAFAVGRRQAFLAGDALAYSESYFGLSTHGHPQAKRLAAYLFCVMGSNFALYQHLMTSGQFGVERDTVPPMELRTTLLVPFEQLNARQLKFVDAVYDWVKEPEAKNWQALDEFVNETLGLSRSDTELIADRLATGLPFAAFRQSAQARPTPKQVSNYVERVQAQLSPFATPLDSVRVSLLPDQPGSPWRFISVHRSSRSIGFDTSLRAAAEMGASQFDSSRIEIPSTDEVIIGVLNQRRYWSNSAARSLALTVIREHVELLDGAKA